VLAGQRQKLRKMWLDASCHTVHAATGTTSMLDAPVTSTGEVDAAAAIRQGSNFSEVTSWKFRHKGSQRDDSTCNGQHWAPSIPAQTAAWKASRTSPQLRGRKQSCHVPA